MSIMGIDHHRYNITYGYDIALQGFWLVIEDYSAAYDEDKDEGYVFHNMIHWPTISMSITEVQDVLSKFNETIPKDDLEELYTEAATHGYFIPLHAEDFIPTLKSIQP